MPQADSIQAPPRDVWIRAVLLWGIVVLLGIIAFALFDATPGTSAAPPEANAPTPHRKPQLLAFLHPRCPCSEATFDAIAELMSKHEGQLDLRVVMSVVDDSDLQSPLYIKCQALTRNHIDRDVTGRIAAKFDAHTSGQVMLYNAAGALAFRGGLTSSRGERGESDGSLAIDALLSGAMPRVIQTPVFGCPLE